jgi:hypothetical protein
MSGLITGIVLDRYPNGGGERLVAVALADNAHRDGTHIFPSIAEIADRTKLSRRSVQMHVSKMVATGWLILTKKSTGRRGDTNEYRICPAWLAGGECTPPSGPVLRTNARKSWGAEIAPHEPVDKPPGWGAAERTMGCNPQQDGVQPTAPKPSGTVKEPIPPNPPTGGAPGFEAIAAGYPRRAGIEAARRDWDELAPSPHLQAEIARAISAWIPSAEWQREGGRYVPKFGRFLRDRRWLDAPGLAVRVAPAPSPAPPPKLTREQLVANGAKAREAFARLYPAKRAVA